MEIVVCVKQVLDPETPPSAFRIDAEAMKVVAGPGTKMVIDPFSENAVEGAVQLKEKVGGKVSVVCIGPATAKEVINQALAMGADQAFLLTDPLFENMDSYGTAAALASAITKIRVPDLILVGRESGDWSTGQTGAGIAGVLGLPFVSLVKKIEDAGGGKVRVERVLDDGYEVLGVQTPAVLTISNEIGKPRYVTAMGIMKGRKKPVTNWSAADLGLDAGQTGPAASRVKIYKLYVPVRESTCDVAEGDTPADTAASLVQKLRAAKVI